MYVPCQVSSQCERDADWSANQIISTQKVDQKEYVPRIPIR